MQSNDLLLLAPFAIDAFLAAASGQTEGEAVSTRRTMQKDSDPAAIADAMDTGASTGDRGLGYSLDHGVAVIRIDGSLDRHARFGFFTGTRYATGYDEIEQAVDRAAADPQARAILLAINSPGGVVPGCKELADHIAGVAAQKPMAAYADGLMASAAFWIGAATGTVYAPRTATVGSIGVIMVHADVSRLNERAGVKYSYITGGTYKAAGHGDAPLSDADREYLEARVNALHQIFRGDVAAHLGLDMAAATAWGDGQVFVDSEALQLGLVSNTVSGLPEAITRLGQEVNMDKTQLAAQHPELLAELEKEAATAQASAVECAEAKATEAARAEVMAWVEQLAGADMRAKIESVMQAGISPEQYKAVAAVMQPAATMPEDDTKAKILAGIEAATPKALEGAAAGATTVDETRAAIDRMAKM